jgi:thymidylate synthase
MIVLSGDSANELYVAAAQSILREGQRVSPRGMATTEIIGCHMLLRSPRRRVVDLPPVRVINPAFAIAEMVWILSGSDDPWIFTYNRALEQFADDGRLQGAYGPRMRRWADQVDQLDSVRQLLLRDPDSRQAVISLFNPAHDFNGHRDVPCTLGYQFFIRNGRLDMHTRMRSQDLWLGFPYDVFSFTVLHELMAGWVDVELGEYHHHVGSLHLYERDIAQAERLPVDPVPSWEMPPSGVQFDALTLHLAAVRAGATPEKAEPWATFADVMTSYRSWARGNRPRARELAAGTTGRLGRHLEEWYRRLDAQRQ